MRFSYRAAGLIAAAVGLTLLAACSRAQQDWRVAQKTDTAQAYEGFVRSHPDSELAAVARQRVAQLTEEAVWQQATTVNTAAAYQDYLAKYPNGSWSQDARIRMESRLLAEHAEQDARPAAGVAQATGLADGRVAAPGWPGGGASRASEQTTFAAQPRPVAAKPLGPTPGAAAAVQLGAFSSIANAHSAWRQLSSKFGPELTGLSAQVVPVTSSGRRLYRLQARVETLAAARRLCRQLQQRSQGCLPVP